MQVSRVLGSWPVIIAILVVPYFCQYVLKVKVELITFQLSVLALTFTQLVLREQNKDSEIDKQIQHEQLEVEKRIEAEISASK